MPQSAVKLPILTNLHTITEHDHRKTNTALEKAFEKDPIWSRILEEFPDKYPFIFGVPLKYALRYGKAYAPTSNIEGAAIWIGSPFIDMNIFRLIRSRSLGVGLKIGLNLGLKIMKAFEIAEKDRRTFMKGQSYVYLLTLGIHPDFQRQGHGFNLVKSMLDALPNEIPVYLETGTEGNVKFYEKLGFEVINEITEPIFDSTFWELMYKKQFNQQ
ncbi:MAG: N-acetyltransferase [Promethearchaeota archaeon]|nr:MAG: N-acetyltransferase [Candidatus Lokiarchaeota archaeon]